MGRRIDLFGQRFGRWTVLMKAPSVARCTVWLCRCDCGVERGVLTQSLRAGISASCGCLCREINRASPNATTHGRKNTPEYSVYCGIKRRCENPNEKCYPRYGGRGIRCLFRSFEEFFAEAGERPSRKHQIDRIDNNGHYEPGNIRWVLPKQQQRNRGNSRIVTVGGRSMCLAEACETHGKPYQLTWQRIFRDGVSPNTALGVSE